MKETLILFLILSILFSCDKKDKSETSIDNEKKSLSNIEPVESPAGKSSEEPNLSVSRDGQLLMSWIETGEKNSKLFYSRWSENSWSSPGVIAEGTDWFVNWADFPSIIKLNDGTLASHYLQKSGHDTYAYGVRIKFLQSDTWTEPVIPHRDNTPTEHGFVSMLPFKDNRLLAVWLDGRNFAEAGNKKPTREMTLRSAVISPDGSLSAESILDERICDCCQTDAVLTNDGPVVVYRDRSLNEIRDISLVRYENNKWTSPVTVHSDNWEIPGCPVNGPAIDAKGNKLVIAWFTAAKSKPSVKVKFSDDAGRTFENVVSIEEDKPLGRVDVIMLEDHSALVSWMEEKDEKAVILVRKVYPNGSLEEPDVVYQTSASRASGFPRMAAVDDNVIFAWTIPGEVSQVLTAIGKLN